MIGVVDVEVVIVTAVATDTKEVFHKIKGNIAKAKTKRLLFPLVCEWICGHGCVKINCSAIVSG